MRARRQSGDHEGRGQRALLLAYVAIGVCWLASLLHVASLVHGLFGPANVDSVFYSLKLARTVPRTSAYFVLAAQGFVLAVLSWLIAKIVRLELVIRKRSRETREDLEGK